MEDNVEVTIAGIEEKTIEVPLHAKRPEMGTKKVRLSGRVLLSRQDADDVAALVGKKVTLMNVGNCAVDAPGSLRLLKDDNDFSGTLKLTWLPAGDTLPVKLRYYGHLVTKAILLEEDDFRDYVNEHSLREFNGLVQPDFLQHVARGDVV